MRVLFTSGGGKSGSWKIRGEQIGKAFGGDVIPRAQPKHIKAADVVVGVKRLTPELVASLKGKPWVWDVVDAYPQPACSTWNRSEAIGWFSSVLKRYRPAGVIFPTRRMAEDCKPKLPHTVIYHHHRIGMRANQISESVAVGGYEGSVAALGTWLGHVAASVPEFRVNDFQHADIDVCFAFRDERHNGYAQKHWKSNVKLSNCHGSGTPFIGAPECGYMETAAGGEVWVSRPEDIADAVASLTYAERLEIRRRFIASAISVYDSALELRQFLRAVV